MEKTLIHIVRILYLLYRLLFLIAVNTPMSDSHKKFVEDVKKDFASLEVL